MATVIDKLVIELGLDPAPFQRGQREAATAFVKTRDEGVKSAKIIEESGKRTADTLRKISRELLTLFAVFTGARGLKDFVADVTAGNAALGRLAGNLATSPQTLAAWGMAAERMGGSAEATAASFQKISKSLYDLYRNGQMLPKEFGQLRSLTGVNIDPAHGIDKFLNDTATALKKLNEIDPRQAYFMAQGLGIDEATANAMIKYGAGFNAYINSLKPLAPDMPAIKAAQRLQEQWATLTQTATKLGTTILTAVSPAIERIVGNISKWIDANREWIASGVNAAMEAFGKFITDPSNIKAFEDAMRGIADSAVKTAHAIGVIIDGLERVFESGGGHAMYGGGGPGYGILSGIFGGKGDGFSGAGAGGRLSGSLPPSGGPLHRYHRRRPDGSLDPSLMNDNLGGGAGRDRLAGGAGADLLTDGRPVGRANPMPVVFAQQQGGGGGFWSNLLGGISSLFGGGGPPAGGGGGGGGGSGGGNHGGGGASVPDIAGMTAKERNTLGLILKYESHGKNVMNYEGLRQGIDPATPKGYTAQGYYQMLNSNWARLAPKLGIKAKNAMAATLEEQTKVALALLRQGGVGNWADFNPALRAALARGEDAGRWAHGVTTGASIPDHGRDAMRRSVGASGSAAVGSISNDNRSSNSTSEVNIGKVDVNTQATDAVGIATSLSNALRKNMRLATLANSANYGLR